MHLYILNNEKGRAVYCDTAIQAGTVIEICPVIVCPPDDRKAIDTTYLYNYYFLWGDNHELTAIALGFGSLYNHSYSPNAYYQCFYEQQIIKIIALQHIDADTEITINYNYDSDSKELLWFEVL